MTNEQLALMVKAGAVGAELELWESVHLFIEAEARKYAAVFKDRTTVEDLAQSGYFAMLDAASLYDTGKGPSFLKVLRFCLQKQFATVAGVRTSKRDALQYADSAEESAYRDDPDGPTISDMIADESAALAFSSVDYVEFLAYARRLIFSALNTLPDKQRDLLAAYYFTGCALKDAGQLAGYSCKQSAFDALNRALRYLRRGSRSHELRECLETFEEFTAYWYAADNSGGGRFIKTGMSATEAAALLSV